MNEAFPALVGSDGNIKPFEQFYKEVSAIHDRYNRHYLRAEYNFVHASAQMAARWEEFAADGDDYNLQYRTAGDNRVREEHRALDGVTLPFSDPFWEEFLPPNGWNCRCSVVQVRKSKYPVTDAADARRRGEQALQRDTRGMFRFNPGAQQKTVPDYNPYTISACKNCNSNKRTLDFMPMNILCEACALINECYNDLSRSESSVVKKHYLHKMEHLLSKKIEVNGNGHTMSVGFTRYGNKHLYSDTFGRTAVLKKDDLESLDVVLSESKFIKKARNYKLRDDEIKRFYYYKGSLHGRTVYLNVAEKDLVSKSGKLKHYRFLYSITDKIK